MCYSTSCLILSQSRLSNYLSSLTKSSSKCLQGEITRGQSCGSGSSSGGRRAKGSFPSGADATDGTNRSPIGEFEDLLVLPGTGDADAALGASGVARPAPAQHARVPVGTPGGDAPGPVAGALGAQHAHHALVVLPGVLVAPADGEESLVSARGAPDDGASAGVLGVAGAVVGVVGDLAGGGRGGGQVPAGTGKVSATLAFVVHAKGVDFTTLGQCNDVGLSQGHLTGTGSSIEMREKNAFELKLDTCVT